MEASFDTFLTWKTKAYLYINSGWFTGETSTKAKVKNCCLSKVKPHTTHQAVISFDILLRKKVFIACQTKRLNVFMLQKKLITIQILGSRDV